MSVSVAAADTGLMGTRTVWIAIVLLSIHVEADSSPCDRQCNVNEAPKECQYTFTLELYEALSKACFNCPYNQTDCQRPDCVPVDGVQRTIVVANRQLPGPAIRVCENDTIVVNVKNRLLTGEVSVIHWHGMLQIGSPFMDGVGMVTQCPILPHTDFTYRFRASPAGTHFWHSHTDLQRGDGLFGLLIVKQPDSREPNRQLYDADLSEHQVLVTDWTHVLTSQKFARHHHDNGTNKPDSILINGRGVFNGSDGYTETPVSIFNVTAGKRYRFRIVSNAVLNCPIEISVVGHRLLVIATEGGAVQPFGVDRLVIYSGESFDFVLTANQTAANYRWLARGLADGGPKFTKAFQLGILHYATAAEPRVEQVLPDSYYDLLPKDYEVVLNPLNEPQSALRPYITQLHSIDNASVPDIQSTPDRKFYIRFDFYSIDNFLFNKPDLYPLRAVSADRRLYMPQFNRITSSEPHSPLLLAKNLTTGQRRANDEQAFCNEDSLLAEGVNCSVEFCFCLHRLQVSVGQLVEFVFVDEGFQFDASHPIHLHGTGFHVVAMDKLGSSLAIDELKRLDKQGNIARNLANSPVYKNSVVVPDGGYTIVRFRATNPGVWLLHCHLTFHMVIGMGLVLQVGQPTDWLKLEPPGLLRCTPDYPVTAAAASFTSHFYLLVICLVLLRRLLI